MNIRENEALAPFTTFRIGGPARYFTEVSSEEDLMEAVSFAREKIVPFFILGGGSNLLISDEGFSGLVIKNSIKGVSAEEKDGVIYLYAGAGENWDKLTEFAADNDWQGIENLSGIPGTAGAAPVQNIGAYGREIKDVLHELRAVDSITGEEKIFTKNECHFGYRDSFFKSVVPGRYIIFSVIFRLIPKGRPEFSYADLEKHFSSSGKSREDVSIKEIREAVLSVRKNKLPPLDKFGTAGSFFKNPVIAAEKMAELSGIFPDIPVYKAEDGVKVSAAYLIDKIGGFKGVRKGLAGVYENQALVLVNHGGASSAEILRLSEEISEKIFEKTGIKLEREVELVGEF